MEAPLEPLPLVRFDVAEGDPDPVPDRRAAHLPHVHSDTRKFAEATGWAPTVGVADGVRLLHDWLTTTRREPVPVQAILAS